MMIQFYTSALDAYDSFSTRTVAIVGRDNRSGHPVRLVECEERDYEWQTGRYSSGLCRFASERVSMEDYEMFGDWTIDRQALDKATGKVTGKATGKPRKRPAYVAAIEAERDEAKAALEALQEQVAELKRYLTSGKFQGNDELSAYVNVTDVLNRI